MPPKSALPSALPLNTDEASASEVTARPKRPASATKKAAPKLTKAPGPKTPKPSGKILSKSAAPVAAKTSSRSPARSATQTQTSRPVRRKKSALPTLHSLPDSGLRTELDTSDLLLSEKAHGTTVPEAETPTSMASDKALPVALTPPVVNDAELWEQSSPIKLRIAQLKTRNALLDEQLQRLRPPFHVRGIKK